MNKHHDKPTSLERKRATRSERRSKRREAITVHNLSDVAFPEGVTVVPFSEDFMKSCYQPGIIGAIGQLKSLLVGKTMDEALLDVSLRTYFSKSVDLHEILRAYHECGVDGLISDREEEFKAKVGPFFLSHYKTWAQKVGSSFIKKTPADMLSNKTLSKAVDIVKAIYREKGKVSVGLPSTYKQSVNRKSSTGYPFFTSKDRWEAPLDFNGVSVIPVNWAFDMADELYRTGDFSPLMDMPYIMFTRKQFRGMDSKNVKANERPVQCSPLLERAVGLPLQARIQQVQRSIDFSMGLGGMPVMRGPIGEALQKFDACFEADYSAFDTSISDDSMTLVASVFKEVIEEGHLVDELFKFYKSAKLMTPTGMMSGSPSLMSGSMLTNAIGMCWGHIAWTYFTLRCEEEGITFDHAVYGYSDDLAVFLNEKDIKVAEMFPLIVGELGLVAHKDKQKTSVGEDRSISFLGHVFSRARIDDNGAQPMYPLYRGLSKLIWREHLDDGFDEDCVYDISGLTKREQELGKVMQRLDNFQWLSNFQDICAATFKLFGVTSKLCARFKADTPAFFALDVFEHAEGPINDDEVVEVEHLTADELDELKSLYLALVEEESSVAQEVSVKVRNLLRHLKRVAKATAKRSCNATKEVGSKVNTTVVYPSCVWPRPSDGGGDGLTTVTRHLDSPELDKLIDLANFDPKKAREVLEFLRTKYAERASLQDNNISIETGSVAEETNHKLEVPHC